VAIFSDDGGGGGPGLQAAQRTSVAAAVFFIAGVGYVMALTQVPARVTAMLLTLSSDKNVILLLINVLLLVLGCVLLLVLGCVLLLVLGCLLDMAPSILICTPILLPVVVKFGVDPVHFGMIMLLNLGIGLYHPPVSAILFVGCAVGRVTIEQVVREIWPFYAVMFIVLMLVTYIPSIFTVAASPAVVVIPGGIAAASSPPADSTDSRNSWLIFRYKLQPSQNCRIIWVASLRPPTMHIRLSDRHAGKAAEAPVVPDRGFSAAASRARNRSRSKCTGG
jgi:Tripartite ATP-independent periplasmic transporter, DctM component